MQLALSLLVNGVTRFEHDGSYNELDLDSDDGMQGFDEIMADAGVPKSFLDFWERNYENAECETRDESDYIRSYRWIVCKYYEANPTKTVHEISQETLVPQRTIRDWVSSLHVKGVCDCDVCYFDDS